MNRTFMTHQSRLALQSQRCCMIEAERDLSFLVQECRMEENGVHFFHSVRLIASWIVDFISETLQSGCYL